MERYFLTPFLSDIILLLDATIFLNLSLLSAEGKVLKFGENLEVPYKVSVKFNGETKEYSFVSKVIYEEEVYESL